MKKLRWVLVGIFFLNSSYSYGLEFKKLFSYVDKLEIKDNRKGLKKGEVYLTNTKFTESDNAALPHYHISATGDKKNIEQIFLQCQQCKLETISPELSKFCQDQVADILKNVWKKELSVEQIQKITPPKVSDFSGEIFITTLNTPEFPVKMKLKTTRARCDGDLGYTVRVDFVL